MHYRNCQLLSGMEFFLPPPPQLLALLVQNPDVTRGKDDVSKQLAACNFHQLLVRSMFPIFYNSCLFIYLTEILWPLVKSSKSVIDCRDSSGQMVSHSK